MLYPLCICVLTTRAGLSQPAFGRIGFWSNNQKDVGCPFPKAAMTACLLYSKQNPLCTAPCGVPCCRNTHWHQNSLLHCALGYGSTYEITLLLVMHIYYCLHLKSVY